MRLLLVPALALALSAGPVMAADDDAPAPLAGTLTSNSRVRFGPSKSAKDVVTLKSGATVEVFGKAKSDPEWYVIRFPKEGRVWVHQKNLAPIDGGARWKVTVDKTRARNDSRITAEVVAELNQGEIVEDKGDVVGEWRSVTIPDAIAYVHTSLVALPQNQVQALQQRQERAAAAEAVWSQALATYTQYLDTVKANPKAAINCDWASLAMRLDTVIADHASASTRLAAKRIRESIAALLPAATQVAQQQGVQPPAPIQQPAPQPTAPAPGAGTAPQAGSAPTATTGPAPLTAEQVEALNKAKPKPSPWQAEGILMQDDQWLPKVGTRDVLVDGDGNVVAFIKSKDGADLKLSELLYREVGAAGLVEATDPAKTGLATPVKLITASDVAPLRR
jgi:uncharacterized protein YgiM (DUF1202 family)